MADASRSLVLGPKILEQDRPELDQPQGCLAPGDDGVHAGAVAVVGADAAVAVTVERGCVMSRSGSLVRRRSDRRTTLPRPASHLPLFNASGRQGRDGGTSSEARVVRSRGAVVWPSIGSESAAPRGISGEFASSWPQAARCHGRRDQGRPGSARGGCHIPSGSPTGGSNSIGVRRPRSTAPARRAREAWPRSRRPGSRSIGAWSASARPMP